ALVELLLAAVAPRTVIADARVQVIHEIEHDTTRAPALRQLAAAERIALADLAHEVRGAAAPAVDRLLGVGDDHAGALAEVSGQQLIGEGMERFPLRDGRVLE